MSSTTEAVEPRLRTATNAVYLVFFSCGFGFASWASRIPQVRDELGLTPAELGAMLLAVAIGSLLSLPTAGLVVHRLGTVRGVRYLAVLTTIGLAVAGVGASVAEPMVVVGLLLLGYGNGTWDVSMNVEAAGVEQRLGRSIMSRFHAGFSVGTVAGALVGAGMNAVDVPVTVHLPVVAVVVAVTVWWAAGRFLGIEEEHAEGEERRSPLKAWTEKRTLLVGLFVLTMAFSEGTGNDWLGVAAIDGHGASDAMGSLVYVVFVAAMTVGRWFGAELLDRFGRVQTLRLCATAALVGLLVVVLGPGLWSMIPGAILWGLGTSLGFPTGMSAAADDPKLAAGRVSAVATIGYVAFLAGPALIGAIGDQVGVLKALSVAAGLLGVGLLVSGATRPLEPTGDTAAR